MTPEQIQALAEEQGPYVFDRMFSAVEKVRERLERTCAALEQAKIPYAVIGGHAVAAWVATKDDGAVRNTRDVDILLRDEDIDTAEIALKAVGFQRETVMNVTMFLDGPDGKPSQAVHVIRAGQKVKEDYASAAPDPDQSYLIDGRKIIDLIELVRMKLNSNRDKDRTHLRDMISVGLIDENWPEKFEPSLASRLQELIDDPDG
jgi:hypothetical protein